MNQLFSRLFLLVLLPTALPASAATRYVDINSTNPVPPYTSWAAAANVIQDAVDAAEPGDEVLVTNGVYATGGRRWFDSGTNRVTITNSLIVRSVNGPEVTFIQGSHAPGTNAVRCALLTTNAILTGFTLTNGRSGVANYPQGGGVYCYNASGIISNCVLVGNLANDSGGGAYRGTLIDCVLRGNSATNSGGGAYNATLIRCTLSDNSARNGGGRYVSGNSGNTITDNCLIVSNTAAISGGGSYGGRMIHCTLVGNAAGTSGGAVYGGSGAWLENSIAYSNSAPLGSDLIGTKANYSCTMTAISGDGNITNAPVFVDPAAGDFRLQPNSPCINAGNNANVTRTNDLDGNPRIVGGTVDMGAYEYQFVPSLPATRYVDINSTNPVPPYTNWATAANVIQDAVDAAEPGDEVLVTNGVYATGGKAIHGTMTNRVAVDKPLTLLSVNGPEFTVIMGYKPPVTWTGAIRCVYLTNGALLSGFSLTNGSTQDASDPHSGFGGGVFCSGTAAVISNCVISGSSARWHGGGCYSGTLIDCTISHNLAVIGGGGTSQSVLANCLVISNSATRNFGGGANGSTLFNCLVVGNDAGHGGGCENSSLINCTVVNNAAMFSGGGVRNGAIQNSVVIYNNGGNYSGSTFDYSCSTPPPTNGLGNITNAPLFVDTNGWADLRLQPDSPCINSGNNAYVTGTNDLDGNPRIVGGTVDMGAYEFQSPQSVISYAWLQQYGLPTDGSADFAFSDTDPHNNYQEWKTWTDPTDELSFLRMLNPAPGTNGTLVSWQSVAGHRYFVERAGDAAGSFDVIQSNITGQAGVTSFTDTNAVGGGTVLYRVGVPE